MHTLEPSQAKISIHAPREGGDQLTPFNAKGGY